MYFVEGIFESICDLFQSTFFCLLVKKLFKEIETRTTV